MSIGLTTRRVLSGLADFCAVGIAVALARAVPALDGTWVSIGLPIVLYSALPLVGQEHLGTRLLGIAFLDSYGSDLSPVKRSLRFLVICIAFIVAAIANTMAGLRGIALQYGAFAVFVLHMVAWGLAAMPLLQLRASSGRTAWWDKPFGTHAVGPNDAIYEPVSSLAETSRKAPERTNAPRADTSEPQPPAIAKGQITEPVQVVTEPVQVVAKPVQVVAKPAPQSAFHDAAYELVAKEFTERSFDQALLIRATNEGGTDKEVVKALYIRLRVEKLVAELRAAAVEANRVRVEEVQKREAIAQQEHRARAAELAQAKEQEAAEKKNFLNSDLSREAVARFHVCINNLRTTPNDIAVLLIFAFFFGPFIEHLAVIEVMQRFGAAVPAESAMSTNITYGLFAAHALLGYAVHFRFRRRWLARAQEAARLFPLVKRSAEAGSELAAQLIAQPILKVAKILDERKIGA